MVEFLEFLKNCTKLYFGPENRDESYDQINQNVLWFQPYLLLLIIYLWYVLMQKPAVGFGSILYTIFKFSIGSFFTIYLYYKFMVILGGIGNLRDSYRIGLSVWIFPSLLHLLFSTLIYLFPNQIFGVILGILSLLVIVWTLIISVLVYSRIHLISIEYSLLAIFSVFALMSLIVFLLKLTL